ncbi:MAG: helix-turn-helix transcriptional regulator [Chloroflexi bacterium]|nr:helix-turn-helix transcriptional regulator [Chloroflexota bacterium]
MPIGSRDKRSEPALLLLVSLAEGPKHGYAMMEDIESFAGVRLGPGTLYGALERLERDGLIEPMDSPERRRPYRLTDSGASALRAGISDMHRLALTGRRRMLAR